MNRIQIKLYSANGQLYNWNESYEIHVHTKNYKLQKNPTVQIENIEYC